MEIGITKTCIFVIFRTILLYYDRKICTKYCKTVQKQPCKTPVSVPLNSRECFHLPLDTMLVHDKVTLALSKEAADHFSHLWYDTVWYSNLGPSKPEVLSLSAGPVQNRSPSWWHKCIIEGRFAPEVAIGIVTPSAAIFTVTSPEVIQKWVKKHLENHNWQTSSKVPVNASIRSLKILTLRLLDAKTFMIITGQG